MTTLENREKYGWSCIDHYTQDGKMHIVIKRKVPDNDNAIDQVTILKSKCSAYGMRESDVNIEIQKQIDLLAGKVEVENSFQKNVMTKGVVSFKVLNFVPRHGKYIQEESTVYLRQ